MSENLKSWVKTITELTNCVDLKEILEGLRDMLEIMWFDEDIEDEEYLSLCQEIMYILYPNIREMIC